MRDSRYWIIKNMHTINHLPTINKIYMIKNF